MSNKEAHNRAEPRLAPGVLMEDPVTLNTVSPDNMFYLHSNIHPVGNKSKPEFQIHHVYSRNTLRSLLKPPRKDTSVNLNHHYYSYFYQGPRSPITRKPFTKYNIRRVPVHLPNGPVNEEYIKGAANRAMYIYKTIENRSGPYNTIVVEPSLHWARHITDIISKEAELKGRKKVLLEIMVIDRFLTRMKKIAQNIDNRYGVKIVNSRPWQLVYQLQARRNELQQIYDNPPKRVSHLLRRGLRGVLPFIRT